MNWNYRHRIGNQIIDQEYYDRLPKEEQQYYVPTVGAITHNLMTEEDVERYLFETYDR